ncbi:MAG: tRNA dihydrouridine(20/20a) synthase DusA [Alphaproteobacteria bacterium]|nr:MAG: tRNA dihydrouridine(20/20a) synthase DusA [Alphaproteobacteria bacterium]
MNKQTIFSVAPMMDWTNRHCRYFHRLLSPSILLYTEMVTANALIHGDVGRHLRYDDVEHPLSLQLGGSDPKALAKAVTIASPYGYDEINLNCGCPSDRVQSGAFGACLMAQPETVRECVQAMQDVSNVPITVKCRIGIDDADENTMLRDFIRIVSESGCDDLTIHARKAWLKGLSPKENREVPPLNYNLVKQIKQENPTLKIHLNGGITTLETMKSLADDYDGLMIGRAAYQNPRILIDIEREFYNADHSITDEEIVNAMIAYANDQKEKYDTPISAVTRHMVNLFQGVAGARKWRQIISEESRHANHGEDVLIPAFNALK